MYRLMQPSEEAAVVALWQAERGDSAAFAKTALEQFAGVENVYVAEENGRLEAAALAVPVTVRGRSGSYLFGLCGKGELLLAGLVDYLCAQQKLRGAGFTVAVPQGQEQAALLEGLQGNLLRLSAGIAVVVLCLSGLLSRALTRKIGQLLTAIREVREGAYSHRAEVPGRDEIAQLAQEFNSLTDRLQTTENARRRFVSDASHELKTPLAAIRLLTDSILQTENIDRETAREFVTDIGQEAERLSRITEDLLRLTRLDSNVLERPVVVDALPVLEQVMRMMSLVAQEKGTELTYRAEGTCTMLATRDEIHQIIYNLTDNAVKYTPPGSTVQVSLFREGDQVVLTVEDNGAGIPEEDLPRIFERFYRVDKARSRAAGGTGLGLAIVRDTVEKRGGTVEAANRPGGGAVCTVRWPWREGGGQT